MSNFIKKRFTEVFHYVSDKPPALFREELGLLLSSSNKRQRVNIRGRFIAENAFEARRKWELGSSSPNMDTWMYLYGEIIDAGEKTHIIISVTNPGAPFAFVPAVFGLVFAYAMADQEEYMQALGAVLLAVIGFPVVFLQIGHYSKNLLRKKFARALDLEPAAN